MASLKHFDRPENTLGFARQALNELYAEWDTFGKSKVLALRTEFNPGTGETIKKLVLARQLPPLIERRATEAVNNIKNTFDQSVFAACAAIRKPVKDAFYPWTDSPVGFEKKRATNTKNIPTEIWDELARQKPYRRTDLDLTDDANIVRDMAALANGKHTVGVAVTCDFSQMASMSGAIFIASGDFRQPIPRWDTEKQEAVLQVTRGIVNAPDPEYAATVQITLKAPPPLGRIDGCSVLEILYIRAEEALQGLKDAAVQLGAS